eukprot:gene19597-30186_t
MSSRPHDSPLSDDGFQQGIALGQYLRSRISDEEQIVVYSSPLVRAVQTADKVIEGFGQDAKISIEMALTETDTAVRTRMLRTHASSVPRQSERIFEGVCRPTLLSPADLMSVSRRIDLSYASVTAVDYREPDAIEVDQRTGEPRTMLQRVHSTLMDVVFQERNLDKTSGKAKAIILIGHGGVTTQAVAALTANSSRPAGVKYTEVFELQKAESALCQEGPQWSVVGSWNPGDLSEQAAD